MNILKRTAIASALLAGSVALLAPANAQNLAAAAPSRDAVA